MNETCWRVREVAEFLRITPKTLYKWLRQGTAPPHLRVRGKRPTFRFDPEAVRAWLAEGSR